MTRSIRLVVALLALAFSAVASAQDAPVSTPRLGLGISVDSSLLSLAPLGNAVEAPPVLLYVPIHVAPSFRLEPSIGWVSVKEGRRETTSPTGTATPELNSSSVSVGLGALYVRPVAPKVQATVGGRASVIWSKAESQEVVGPFAPVVVEASQQNVVIAAVLGGEYLPTPWFSIGLEGQLAHAALGDYETTAAGTTVRHGEGSAWSTNAILTLRTYFF